VTGHSPPTPRHGRLPKGATGDEAAPDLVGGPLPPIDGNGLVANFAYNEAGGALTNVSYPTQAAYNVTCYQTEVVSGHRAGGGTGDGPPSTARRRARHWVSPLAWCMT